MATLDKAGTHRCRLSEQCNHQQQDVDLLLQFCVQETDERMSSKRFFSFAKIVCHKIENEAHGYLTFFVQESLVYKVLTKFPGLVP